MSKESVAGELKALRFLELVGRSDFERPMWIVGSIPVWKTKTVPSDSPKRMPRSSPFHPYEGIDIRSRIEPHDYLAAGESWLIPTASKNLNKRSSVSGTRHLRLDGESKAS